MHIDFRRPLLVASLFCGLLASILASGCKSANSDLTGRMASILVTNRSPEEIDTSIHVVFDRHEFVEGKSDEYKLIFEKPASLMSGVVYSDWYSGGVWERIKVYRRDVKPGVTIVECDGYMVKEHDDPLFAEEKKQYKTKRAHCQKLMDEIAVELQSGGTNNAPSASR